MMVDDLQIGNGHLNNENDTIYFYSKDLKTYINLFDKKDISKAIKWLKKADKK